MNNTKTKILVLILLLASLAVIIFQIIKLNDLPMSTKDKTQEEIDENSENKEGAEIGEGETEEKKEMLCTQNFSPVCGAVNGKEKSFPNQCEAEKAGAEKIVVGLCAPMEGCPDEKDPVCGLIDDTKKNFNNLCIAEAAGAKDIEPGPCPISPATITLCPEMPDPVCATFEGKKKDYENACVAQQAGATEINQGKCPVATDLNLVP